MKRFMTVFAIVFLVLTAFIGCAFAASLDEIKAKGVIRVATTDFDFEPFVFSKDGQVVGLDVDLAQALADAIGVKLELVRVPWDGGIALAWDPTYVWDKFDVAAAAITIKSSREEICTFSEWYFTPGQMILVRKDSGFAKKEDIVGKKIASMKGSTGFEAAEKLLKGAMVPLANYPDCFKAVIAKEVDAAVMDGPAALLEAKNNPDLMVFEELLTRERYGVAMPKGQDALLQIVTEVVTKVRADLYKKWFE